MNRRCYCCGRKLKKDRFKYLELNALTNRFYDPDKHPVAASESQGLFVFGLDCARAVEGYQKAAHEAAFKGGEP